MWLIIRESDNAVVGTNYNVAPPAPPGHRVVEWAGPEPPIHEPPEVESYDPTPVDSDYPTFADARDVFDDLEVRADAEVAWLESVIPTIDAADLEALRAILKRLAQQNLRMVKAWRYLWRRLG
jgi:hypothetical protein